MLLIKRGDKTHFVELKEVQALINHWFEDEASKVLLHIDMEDVKGDETVRIHHHEIHKKRITQSSILQLQLEGEVVTGHKACEALLTKNVINIISNNSPLDSEAQTCLLDELDVVFTDKDNKKLLKVSDKEEIKSVLQNSNL